MVMWLRVVVKASRWGVGGYDGMGWKRVVLEGLYCVLVGYELKIFHNEFFLSYIT